MVEEFQKKYKEEKIQEEKDKNKNKKGWIVEICFDLILITIKTKPSFCKIEYAWFCKPYTEISFLVRPFK